MTCNLRHPMNLHRLVTRHPVHAHVTSTFLCVLRPTHTQMRHVWTHKQTPLRTQTHLLHHVYLRFSCIIYKFLLQKRGIWCKKNVDICFSFRFSCIWCERKVKPPKKLFENGVSTPYALFVLICTISSELTCIFIFTHLSEPRLISLGFSGRVRHPLDSNNLFVRRRTMSEKHE